MMLKTAAADGWAITEPSYLIKRASRGLLGLDRQQFVKRAGAEFADKLDRVVLAPDEELVHIPLVGTTEYYGRNRNGDGFPKRACELYHDTFVKLGRLYENHANDDPAVSYGRIPVAHFLPDMGRIDVVAGYNGSEKTAAVNGGLVDTRVLAELHAGRATSHSMSCRVPFDRCSSCGNKARTRDDYCDASMCKHGGLRENIGGVGEDGHALHAINDHPYFFDCSRVPKPAERIAQALGIVKKASLLTDHRTWIGPELDEYRDQFDCQEMAVLETTIKSAAYHKTGGDFVTAPFGHSATEQLAALAQAQILLPFREFLQVCGSSEAQAKVAAATLQPFLGRLYRDLLEAPHTLEAPAAFSSRVAPQLQKWASSLAADYSLHPRHGVKRAQRVTLRGDTVTVAPVTTKTAGTTEQQLLDEYRDYQRSFLATVARDFPADFSVVRLLTVGRNKVS